MTFPGGDLSGTYMLFLRLTLSVSLLQAVTTLTCLWTPSKDWTSPARSIAGAAWGPVGAGSATTAHSTPWSFLRVTLVGLRTRVTWHQASQEDTTNRCHHSRPGTTTRWQLGTIQTCR